MEHYTFLWQMILIALSFTSIVILIQKYTITGKRVLLYFISAIILLLSRTIIFAIARYGNISSFFILPKLFANQAAGGLVYVFLIYSSHFLILQGFHRLTNRKVFPADIILFILISLNSLLMYTLIILNVDLSMVPCFWRSIEGLSIVPIVVVKLILFYNALKLSFIIHKDYEQKGKTFLYLFFMSLSLGQICDGLFYFMESFRVFTLAFSIILTFTGILILLPIIVKILWGDASISQLNIAALNKLCSQMNLDDDEKELIKRIVQGKSNKEIAYENNTTLSIIKHKIYNLYRKCSINSRWELINLVIN